MIAARDMTVRVAGRTIIDAVSLSIAPGRVTALLGPNGAGKSTIISVLSGERFPALGHVEIDRVPMAALTPLALARRRAVLLQQSSLDFDFIVEEVVALGRLPFAATDERFDDAAACSAVCRLSGIEEFRTRLYRTLSGGERQRVQFARALAQIWRGHKNAGAPRYLLLDEPTSALDLRHRRSLLATARRLATDGIGVLAVLHDLSLAADYADDVVLLESGRVLAAGSRDEVLTENNLARCFGMPVEIVARADGSKAILV